MSSHNTTLRELKTRNWMIWFFGLIEYCKSGFFFAIWYQEREKWIPTISIEPHKKTSKSNKNLDNALLKIQDVKRILTFEHRPSTVQRTTTNPRRILQGILRVSAPMACWVSSPMARWTSHGLLTTTVPILTGKSNHFMIRINLLSCRFSIKQIT